MMDLFDEDILKPKKKKTFKMSTIILAAIILLIVLCIITVIAIIYLKGTILTITLDEKNAKDLEKIFIFEENNKIYVPIRKMAEYLGYDSYNGDYITRSEDKTKCYIETEEELVSFTLNSSILTKVVDGQTQQIKITEPIKEINEELCITSEGAQYAFNLKFYNNVEQNNITIQTLSYLYNGYSLKYQNKGYSAIEGESFSNKTAILDNLLIVKSNNDYYGVIDISTGKVVLETKYDNIQYLRNTSDFLVSSNNRKGIISSDKSTKVQLIYDSIERVTNKNDIFYIVKTSNLYGLLDKNGQTILYPEYQQIGINVSEYSQNGVTNGYIFFNKVIPVKSGNKWGLMDIEGNKVTDFIYDSFGCPDGNNNTYRTYGVIAILDYNIIVAAQSGKYNLITLEGKRLFERSILDSVYITVSQGEKNYYIASGENTKELLTLLEENNIKKVTTTE